MNALDRARGHYQVTFAVLAIGTAAYALLQSLVIPVLPTIQSELHTSTSASTWVLTAYLLSASIFTPIMGRVGDMIGKEKVLVATLVALGAGCLIAAIAPNIAVLLLARVVQGVGGGVLPVAFGIIRDEFPREKLGGAVGMISSLTAAGSGLALVLAGPIVDALSWRWLFWIPMIGCFGAAAAAWLFVPESPVRTPGRISLLPPVLLSGWLVALLLPVSEAPDWGWTSTTTVGLLAAAVVLAAAWVMVELRAPTPLIDMRMMRLPAVWTANLVALLVGVGMYGVFAFLPEFAQTPKSSGYGFGLSITGSGLVLLPAAVVMFLVGFVAGRIAGRIGSRMAVFAGAVFGAIAIFLMAFLHHTPVEMGIAAGIMGVGFGLAFAAMSTLVVAGVPAHQTGVAAGMNANIRTIGGSIGAAVMTSIVTSKILPGGLPAESGYTHGFTLLAAALVLAAVAALAIPRALDGSAPPAAAMPEPAAVDAGGLADGVVDAAERGTAAEGASA